MPFRSPHCKGFLSLLFTGSSGTKGFVDEYSSIEWKSVLPICRDCRADGAIPLAQTKRRNGATHARRAQRDRLTSEAPIDVVTPMEDPGIPPIIATPCAPRTTKCGHHTQSEVVGKHSRHRRLTRQVRG